MNDNKHRTSLLTYLLVFASLGFIFSKPAYAYIDPGMGSYFVQTVIASIASISLFSYKPILKKIKDIFHKKLVSNDTTQKEYAKDK